MTATGTSTTRRTSVGRSVGLGVAAFVLTAGASWAILASVRESGPAERTGDASVAAVGAGEPSVSAPPLAPVLTETDLGLLDVSKAEEGSELLPSAVVPFEGNLGSPAIGEVGELLRAVPLGPAPFDDVTPPPTTSPTSSTTSPTPSTTAPSAPVRSFRFLDPCADDVATCVDLAGRPAIGGTIVLTSGDPEPIDIRSLDVNSGTSDGCAAAEVPTGRRAVGVMLNRPATISLTWWRGGAQVGDVQNFPLEDSDRDRAGAAGWRACLDVEFPMANDGSAAQARVIVSADDGTTDTASLWAYDDDRRRLTIAIVDDDELVAFTPQAPDTTIGAIALRDGEDQIAGCRRAAERLLAERAEPGTEGTTGWSVSDELADAVLPRAGDWTAARFANLSEAQRYAVCLYSYGAGRGDRRLEATDAVLVQTPDREVYRIRPVRLVGPGSIDGDLVVTRLQRSRGAKSWTVTARTATNASHDLSDTEWVEVGDLPEADLLTASVEYDGRTSDALVSLPAHCVGPTTCDPIGATRFVRLDVPGPEYASRLCGTGEAACDGGLRPRGEVIGSIVLAVERVEGRRGFEGWTIGESRRFDAAAPDPYWVRVDATRSRLTVAPDGTVTAEVHTDVPSSLRIGLIGCSPLAVVDATMVESTAPSTDHLVVFDQRLGVGGCAYAGYVVSDPTGMRAEEGAELASVARPPARADLAVQVSVVAWPEDVAPGMGGSVFVSVNGSPARPPSLPPLDRRFGCVAPGTSVPGTPVGVPGSFVGDTNIVTVEIAFEGRCAESGFPRLASMRAELDVALSELTAVGPVIREIERADGLRLRISTVATALTGT